MPFAMMVSYVNCTLTTVPFLSLGTTYVGVVTHQREQRERSSVFGEEVTQVEHNG